jgi:hypothetical protein
MNLDRFQLSNGDLASSHFGDGDEPAPARNCEDCGEPMPIYETLFTDCPKCRKKRRAL